MPVARPAPAAVRTPWWGLGDVLLGFAFGLLGAQLAITLILTATDRSVDEVDDLPLSLVALSQLGLWVGLFGIPAVVTRIKGRGLVADLGLRVRGRDLWRGGLVGALLQLVALPLLYLPLLELLGKSTSDLEGPARSMTDRADGPLGVALLVLIVGIGAPIVEEVFYRGLFLSALERAMSPLAALALSSVVFGAVHLQPLQFPALVMFGAVAALLVQRTGRLGPAVAAHVGFNMTTVVVLLASR